MKFQTMGNPEGPLVVCIHGLMGDADDYRPFAEVWGEKYKLLVPSLTGSETNSSGFGVTVDGKERLIYEFSGAEIVSHLKEFYPDDKPFFAGISYGGKISLEIAQSNPELFGGASITDVGLGPLCRESGLFKFIHEVIPAINFNQPWKSLRKDLKKQIPDRMLRILIQAHITYETKDSPTGTWKGHAYDFHELLKNSTLEDQWEGSENIAAPIHIFKATVESAIDDIDYKKMQENEFFQFIELEGANHFIQINNFEDYRKGTLELINAHYDS